MASFIQNALKAIVDRFDNQTGRDETKALVKEAEQVVRGFYRHELKGAENQQLAEIAADNPNAVHGITKEHFGFKIFEQPGYGAVDDFAWEFSQRYTTLDGVTLPDNAVFYTSERREVDPQTMRDKMQSGQFHLFDIALSNEYVLLDKDEKFSVRDIEKRFSTNNEHLPPQSQSKRDGKVKIFRSDPRAIVISYSDTNGARGHLQVVFVDENGRPKESVAMQRRPGEESSEITRQVFRPNGRSERYPIKPDDAPYYAYALALTHFAGGFSQEADKYWFDAKQAQEVATLLQSIGEKGADNVIEPVMRDLLADAKQLNGNINPVGLMPDVFASALQSEIDRGKFHGSPNRAQEKTEAAPDTAQSFTKRVEASRQQAAGSGPALG